MGMDPESRLAYGYYLGNGDEFKVAEVGEYGSLAVDWYDDEADGGVSEQLFNRLYDLMPEPRPEVKYDWERENAAQEHWGIDLVHSGTFDYSGYILTVAGERTEGSYRSVEWSDAMQLDMEAMAADPARNDWDAKLSAALKALGLTPTQEVARWLVFPFYG